MRKRLFIMSTSEPLQPGMSIMLESSPGVCFKPTGISTDKKFADHFVIEDIMIGKRAQLLGKSSFIPANVFAEPVELELDLCQSPPETIRVKIKNRSEESSHFSICFFGYEP